MTGLTQRQSEALSAVRRLTDRDGVPPSFAQLAVEMGLKSKSGIKRLVDRLEERGAITRRSHCARSIEVIDPALVQIRPDILRMLERYAVQTRTTVETAANELLREVLEA